jgi:uncharacterized membrane protein YfcA
MIDYALVCAVALLASLLTFFSGFGLGTLLMPAFALLFPVPVAIAATAVVHLANNLFKTSLVGRHVDRRVALRFGVPAVLAAFAGAALLGFASTWPALGSWSPFGTELVIRPVNLVIGVVIIGFALFELHPASAKLAFPRRWLPLGGLLAGFFGGLSGHQGALRSAFLIKAGLDKRAFVATGVLIAVGVDVARLAVYGTGAIATSLASEPRLPGLVAAACFAAFIGAWLGNRLLDKLTLAALQWFVGVGMVLVGAGLAAGLV